MKQVEENLGALGWRLSSQELLQLEIAARESPQKMIQNVFQTKWIGMLFQCGELITDYLSIPDTN